MVGNSVCLYSVAIDFRTAMCYSSCEKRLKTKRSIWPDVASSQARYTFTSVNNKWLRVQAH